MSPHKALEEAKSCGLDVNPTTGEILLESDSRDFENIKTVKIKVFKLLTPNDFYFCNNVWEAKKDGLIKILSSLPISYEWKIIDKELSDNYAFVTGKLSISTGNITRSAESMGICELSELKGNGGMHYLIARSSTRALKRSIDILLGSVLDFYIINYLQKQAA